MAAILFNVLTTLIRPGRKSIDPRNTNRVSERKPNGPKKSKSERKRRKPGKDLDRRTIFEDRTDHLAIVSESQFTEGSRIRIEPE